MNASHTIALDTGSNVEHFEPAPEPIRLDRVLRIQGYKDPAKVRRRVMQAAKKAVDEANAIATPVVAWRLIAIQSLIKSNLTLAHRPPVSIQCEAFDQHLANADHVVVYALTAGEAFDSRVSDLPDPAQVLHGLLLETAAWMCIENTTRQFLSWLRMNAKNQSRRISRRLGPGYRYRVGDGSCEWPLDQQHQLFEVFAGSEIPVRLLDSSAMLPKMSRSGLIGVKPV